MIVALGHSEVATFQLESVTEVGHLHCRCSDSTWEGGYGRRIATSERTSDISYLLVQAARTNGTAPSGLATIISQSLAIALNAFKIR